MSVVISRLVLSMLMLPALAFVYLVSFVTLEEPLRVSDWLSFLIADMICVGLMFLIWVLIWHGSVRWTGRRIGFSFAVTVLVAGIVAAIAAFLGATVDDELGVFSWAFGMGAIWPAAMVAVWHETARERRARLATQLTGQGRAAIACLVCGYDMSGLKEARCPECGAEFTLERLLVAGQGGESDSLVAS